MSTITLEEAQQHLAEIIEQLAPGQEIIITRQATAVARLVAAAPSSERKLGSLRGSVRFMAPDFDVPLVEFREYMP
jgi:prevent-host-death family protein